MAVDPTAENNAINSVIAPNGAGLITAARLAAVLVGMIAFCIASFQPLLGFNPSRGSANTLGLLGDSLLANYGTSVTQPCTSTDCEWYSDKNIVFYTLMYSNSRLTLPNTYLNSNQYSNCGIAGALTPAILANVSCVLAIKPDVTLVEGGTNDVAAGSSCASIVANLRSIYSQLNAAGISVIRVSIIPRSGSGTFTTAQANVAQCVNQYDRSYAQINNSGRFTFVDLDKIVIDYTQTAWTIFPSYISGDGTHPTEIGGSVIGNAIAAAINQDFPDWRNANVSNADLFDATNNPGGNLLPYGGMTGNAGSKVTCTGTVVGGNSSYSLLQTAGTPGTCVSSIGTNANGEQTEVVTLSGASGSSGNVFFRQTMITPSNINAGDVIEGKAIVSLGSNSNIAGISLLCTSVEGSNTITFGSSNPSQGIGDPLPSAGYASNPIQLMTPQHAVTATPSAVYCDIRIYPVFNSSVSATVTIAGESLKKVLN